MEEKEETRMQKAKKFTAYGTAFLVLLAMLGGAGTIAKWAWGAVQKIESYTKLPEWLERVESKVVENGRKIDAVDEKLQQIYDELERHRGRTDD